MTFEEFLEWADEDTWAEWVDGEVVWKDKVTLRHQEVAGFLLSVMSFYVEEYRYGEVIVAPFLMKLSYSARMPDLLFIAQEHLDRLTEYYLDGAADLVVEVVSPGSIGADRGEKFAEYEEAGIPEYWIIDPDREQAEFYQLDERGHYQVAVGGDGRYESKTVRGFWLNVGWLWQTPLPMTLDVLRGLGVVH